MRRTVSSNTIPAITAASSFRPCSRYSAPWSRKAQLTGKHRRRRWCGVRPGSPVTVFGREEAPSTTIGLRRGCRDCRAMAFLPRYYLADISQIEYRIAGQVQYSAAPCGGNNSATLPTARCRSGRRRLPTMAARRNQQRNWRLQPRNVAVVVMSAVGIVVAPWEKITAAPGTGARVSLARTEYQMNIRDPEASKRKWPEPKFRPSLNREASRLGDVRVRRPSSRAQVPETCHDQSIASRERWTFERSSTSRNFFWLVCKNCNSPRKLCCVASAEPSFRDFAQ